MLINEQHEHMGTDSNKVNWKNLKGLEGLVFTQGDVFYIDANETWQRLGAGTSGQYLKTQGTGANPTWGTVGKFGGDGSDGALSITSGTTTIDCANAAVVTKNYTSISITGTGKLAFSNPHANGTIIILKSQGNVTITSSTTPCIDVSGMGATGGALADAGYAGVDGNDGSNPQKVLDTSNHYGVKGIKGSITVGNSGAGGAGGAAITKTGNADLYATDTENVLYRRLRIMLRGSGGASGGTGVANNTSGDGAASGAGGNGGGALIIECGGAWNFTGTIYSKGQDGGTGANGVNCGYGESGGGGGGGGGGGSVLVIYNILTANSGTITVTGGAGGSGGARTTCAGTNGSGGGGGGGGGGSYSGAGNNGVNGEIGVNNTYNGAGGAGGASANGFSLVTSNTVFL